ncbi:MAG: outer membrane protein transport protein [Alphaproteobacteria bacterium]|nr:outer membrane protein transport protein [Alphaproteobacteria bacterium]
MKKLVTFTALATVLAIANNANAAGFHLREQSAAAQGNAFAGATAGAENPSYAYFNVAGLTRHKGTQINAGGTYIAPAAEAHNINHTADEQHNIVHAAVAPNGTMSYQLDDKTVLGLSLNVPFGMITKYSGNWAGSNHGVTSRVHSLAITPMAAHKVTDKLSLGAGFVVEHIRARLTNTISAGGGGDVAVHGDATDIGYQLGAMYELNDNTRFGIGYRSEMKHKIHGEMESSNPAPFLNQDIKADLDVPAMLSLGAYHKINDKWEVMAEYQRVYWSSFDRLDFIGDEASHPVTGRVISRVYENWRDTNFYALGASYQIDDQWKARFGIALDQAAVTRADRTPRIPDSDRLWYSAGLNYQYNDKLSFDMAFTYIKAKSAVVNSAENQKFTSSPNVYAEYKNSVKIWGLSLNYKF